MNEFNNIQAVLFDNKKYTTSEARKWLHKHNLKPIKKAHKTINFLRYRINEPEKYKSFITKKISDNIQLIIGQN